MLTVYKGNEEKLETLDEIAPGSWVHLVNPEPQELAQLQASGIPAGLLRHVQDLDERPHTKQFEKGLLIVLHFPYAQGATADIPFITLPLSILITEAFLITIVPKAAGVLEKFASEHAQGLSTADKTQFVLRLLFHLADEFLVALKEINRAVDQLEDQLEESLRNEEVLQLLKYDKSLVYFTTALRSNERILERLQQGHLLPWHRRDEELLADVLIEVRQAIEQVDISQNILGQMTDAFASIVSNNLNVVMKFLAAVTILISLPTLIFTLYGMNINLPGEDHPLAFIGVVSFSLLLSLIVFLVFRKKHWL